MRQISEFRVRYAETDKMGVVYHANYLVWCEIARTDLIRALGTPYAAIEDSGTMLAVAEATLRYKRGARYDDMVRVAASVADVRSRAVTFAYDISLQDGTGLVSASTTLVAMRPDGRSTVLPISLRHALEQAIEG
jgi:acyl-CoA thioester hydrolase